MNNRRRRTIGEIFANPVKANIAWADIEKLIVALDGRVVEGAGSRVRFECGGLVANFHRPHPGKEARHYQVVEVREFLSKIGVEP